MNRKKRIHESAGDRVFNAINYTLLGIVFLLVAYPLVYTVSCSFSSARAILSGRVWLLPVEPTLKGYKAVFNYRDIWVGYGNSLFYTFFGTVINVAMTIMAAYPLSRKRFFGRGLFMGIFTFTMLFSGGLIPTYILMDRLGLLNTRWAMLLPQALAVWYVILARTHFQSIPEELYEAAELDGCSDIGTLFRVILPVSGSIIAVLVLFYAVGNWNAYFDAFIYLTEKRLYPLQVILRNILIQNEITPSLMANMEAMERIQGLQDLLKFSLIVVASGPVLIIYPFVQKYFIKGIMVGSIKG
jgi:ABC-type glycerol-3-phosphate transport system permease component